MNRLLKSTDKVFEYKYFKKHELEDFITEKG